MKKRIFNTNQRVRLGIWGLGRGMSFYRMCADLNIDVVAGCDYNARGTRFAHEGESSGGNGMWFIRDIHQHKHDGLIYIRGTIRMRKAGKGSLLYGVDGPARVWVNGQAAGCQPKARNPIIRDQYRAPATWKQGKNEVLFALDINQGQAWGVCARGELAMAES